MATVTHRIVGATTPAAAKVTAKVVGATNARLKVSTTSNLLTNPIFGASVAVDGNGMVTCEVTGLATNTRYYYGLELDGVLDTAKQGQFRTHPTLGVASNFKFAFGNCSNGDNNVYGFLLARDPLFWIHSGDFHYGNVNSTNEQLYRDQYDTKLASANMHDVVAKCALVDVWDDHDFCGDNSDTTFTGKSAVQNVWRQYFPERGLPATNGEGIYRSFQVGRVLFIVLDTRSHRSPSGNTDNASKTMLGATQKQWLKDTMSASQNPLIFVVSSGPWNSVEATGDSWSRYNTERQELVDYITENVNSGVYFLCGDMHAIAYDDGTNSPGGFPVGHAGSFASTGSVKGGPYSSGAPIQGNRKYGIMDIADNGSDITATFYAYDTASGSEVLATGWPYSDVFFVLVTNQKARPDGVIARGTWTDQAGGTTDIHTAIDEAAPADTDRIVSAQNPTSDIIEMSLSDLTDPNLSTGHVLRYRVRSQDGRLEVTWAELETPLPVAAEDRGLTVESTVTATDTLAQSESTEVVAASSLTAADALGLVEAAQVTAAGTLSAGDVQHAVDDQVATVTSTLTVVDAGTSVESTSVDVAASITVTDGGQLVDVTDLAVVGTVTETSAGQLVESPVVAAAGTVDAAHLAALVDHQVVDVVATTTAADQAALTSHPDLVVTSTVETTAAVVGGESTTLTATSTTTATDALAAAHAVGVVVTSDVTATDVYTEPNVYTELDRLVTGATVVTTTDAAVLAEHPTTLGAAATTTADTAAWVDDPAVSGVVAVTVVDAGAGTEAGEFSATTTPTVVDAGAGVELVDVTAAGTATVADARVQVESVALEAATSVTATDVYTPPSVFEEHPTVAAATSVTATDSAGRVDVADAIAATTTTGLDALVAPEATTVTIASAVDAADQHTTPGVFTEHVTFVVAGTVTAVDSSASGDVAELGAVTIIDLSTAWAGSEAATVGVAGVVSVSDELVGPTAYDETGRELVVTSTSSATTTLAGGEAVDLTGTSTITAIDVYTQPDTYSELDLVVVIGGVVTATTTVGLVESVTLTGAGGVDGAARLGSVDVVAVVVLTQVDALTLAAWAERDRLAELTTLLDATDQRGLVDAPTLLISATLSVTDLSSAAVAGWPLGRIDGATVRLPVYARVGGVTTLVEIHARVGGVTVPV